MTEIGIIKCSRLAELFGVHSTTLHDWLKTDDRLLSCRIRSTKRSTWFSVSRLREAGYLTNAPVEIGGAK